MSPFAPGFTEIYSKGKNGVGEASRSPMPIEKRQFLYIALPLKKGRLAESIPEPSRQVYTTSEAASSHRPARTLAHASCSALERCSLLVPDPLQYAIQSGEGCFIRDGARGTDARVSKNSPPAQYFFSD